MSNYEGTNEVRFVKRGHCDFCGNELYDTFASVEATNPFGALCCSSCNETRQWVIDQLEIEDWRYEVAMWRIGLRACELGVQKIWTLVQILRTYGEGIDTEQWQTDDDKLELFAKAIVQVYQPTGYGNYLAEIVQFEQSDKLVAPWGRWSLVGVEHQHVPAGSIDEAIELIRPKLVLYNMWTEKQPTIRRINEHITIFESVEYRYIVYITEVSNAS